MPKCETQKFLDELVRNGHLVKTDRVRNGKPVYVAAKFATEQELQTQRKSKQ
jgi:hypothetical protein